MEKIEKENVLAVEGKDEKNFFEALLKNLEIADVQVIDVGGKDKFDKTLSLYIQSEGALAKIKNIGFVRDAEDHEAESAFQSICTVLKKYDLPCPVKTSEIAENNGVKAKIFIMPNNHDCGMLEDLCISSVRGTDIFNCVESFTKCYESKIDRDRYNLPKAEMLAYLSTQIPIVNSLGLAARQGVWDFTHQCYNEIKTFLIGLYGNSST